MFDPALKALHDKYPRDWADVLCGLAGLPSGGTPQVVQPNLPPKALDVDRAYRLSTPGPMVLHVEYESSHPPRRPERFLVYNVLLSRQEECPVKTVVILLRPDADSSDMTGRHIVTLPTGDIVHEWNYTVIRLWELPPETFMGHVGTMPLTPLANVARDRLPELANRMLDEYQKLPEHERADLTSASTILTGLRYDAVFSRQLFSRASHMRESTVYQAILDEGREEGFERGLLRGKKATLFQLGEHRFGAPEEAVRQAIDAITDVQRIDRINLRLFTASSWNDLLAVQ